MTSNLLTVFTFVSVCGLAGCAESSRHAPVSAAEGVEGTARGLLRLFEQECVDQRNLAFVRAESERRRNRRCSGPLLNDGSRGDCEQNADLEGVTWTVATSTQAELVVSMNWPVGLTPDQPFGPPHGRVDCSITAPENLRTQLKDAANLLAESNPHLSGPIYNARYNDWVWSPATVSPETPEIALTHRASENRWELASRGFRRSPGG